MKVSRLNMLAALISALAACLWLALGEVLSGFIWLACSLVWLAMSIVRRGSTASEPYPIRRLLHRFSRLLIWS